MSQRLDSKSSTVAVEHEQEADQGMPYLADVPGVPIGLMKPIQNAFASKAGPGGSWRRPDTISAALAAVKRFALEVSEANPTVRGVEDLTPSVLDAWCHWGRHGLAPSTNDIGRVKALLRCVEGLPTPTTDALRPGWLQLKEPYGANKQKALVVESWAALEAAKRRLTWILDTRDLYRAGNEPPDVLQVRIKGMGWYTVGKLLDHISRFGEMPGYVVGGSEQLRALLGVPRGAFKHALYLRTDEIRALQVLLVAECGYSPESLWDLRVTDHSIGQSAPDTQPSRDRGSHEDEASAQEAISKRRAEVHRLGEFLTQPTRETLDAWGHPSDLLLVAEVGCVTSDRARRLTGPFNHARVAGLPILRRLRPSTPPSSSSIHAGDSGVQRGGGDGADSGSHHLSDLVDVHAWSAPLAAAFERLRGPGGAWASTEAARTGEGILRRVVGEISAAYPSLVSLGDINAEMLHEWRRMSIERARGSRASADLALVLFEEAGWLDGTGAQAAQETTRTSRTAAFLPEPRHVLGGTRRRNDLIVTAIAAGGMTCDFTDLVAPAGILDPVISAFRRKVGIGGGWNSPATVKPNVGRVKRFVQDIVAANPGLSTIADFTPEMWWGWAGPPDGDRSATAVAAVRVLLTEVADIPDVTRRALQPQPQQSMESEPPSYRPAEAAAFVDAAWDMAHAKLIQLGPNLDTAAAYRRGEEPVDATKFRIAGEWWSAGRYFNHVLSTGRNPGWPGEADTPRFREEIGIREGDEILTALFLSPVEIYSLLVLFVWEGGYNLSTLNSMRIGGFRADDRRTDPVVLMVEHDKPRRQSRRLSWETLIGSRTQLQAIAEYLPASARETRAALGHPTDRLFVGVRPNGRVDRPEQRFPSHWTVLTKTARAWTERTGVTDGDGRHPTLKRLRATYQNLRERPAQNTMKVHFDNYRRDDPQTLEKARDLLPRLGERIIDGAKAHADQVRTLSVEDVSAPTPEIARQLGMDEERVPQLLNGELDASCMACRDITQSPFGEPGELCPVSYRTCFGCPSAIMTPRHLPGVAVYREELVATTRHLTDEEWQRDYADHYGQVIDALSSWTSEEVDAAKAAATPAHVAVARALLRTGGGRR